MRRTLLTHTSSWTGALLAVSLLGIGGARAEQVDADRPFGEQEELTYRVGVAGFGEGAGSLQVNPSAPLRGEPVVLLRFDFEARVGPFAVSHHSRSWLSTERWASLRYEVHERAPLKSIDDAVEIFPAELRWAATRGRGSSTSPEPLDELSFLYVLRSLPLIPGASLRFDRHYDPRRNPTEVRMIRREAVRVPAGEFQTVLVELEVRDPERCGGRTVLRVNLTEDALRVPVRLSSSCPVELVLELKTQRRTTREEHHP